MKVRESLLMAFLVLNAWNDIRTRSIWLRSAWGFGILGLLYGFGTGEMIFSELWPALLPGLAFLAVGKLSRQSVGYGDGIVIMVMGLYVGIRTLAYSLMLSLVCAAMWAIILVIFFKKKKQEQFPFLPFILLGYLGGLWI